MTSIKNCDYHNTSTLGKQEWGSSPAPMGDAQSLEHWIGPQDVSDIIDCCCVEI